MNLEFDLTDDVSNTQYAPLERVMHLKDMGHQVDQIAIGVLKIKPLYA